MIDAADARKLAVGNVGADVLLGDARELREGWFFAREGEEELAGGHGLIVNKKTGSIFQLGSAFPPERDIALYDLGYQFKCYDLVILTINDVDATRRSVGRLPLQSVEPRYEHGQVWRIPETMPDSERWKRLEKLPCIFPALSLYFHIEVLEEARREGWYEFLALEYRQRAVTE